MHERNQNPIDIITMRINPGETPCQCLQRLRSEILPEEYDRLKLDTIQKIKSSYDILTSQKLDSIKILKSINNFLYLLDLKRIHDLILFEINDNPDKPENVKLAKSFDPKISKLPSIIPSLLLEKVLKNVDNL